MLKISYQRELKSVWITVTKTWNFIISWREDWKYFGLSQYSGFGKYIGIKF